MMSSNFHCTSYGKMILVGEHAVLRGSPALVFPIRSRKLDLNYTYSEKSLELKLSGEHGQDLQLLVWGVLEKACEQIEISRSLLKGTLNIESTIPVGAGMGASAALCVALTRWLGHLGYVAENEYYEFSRNLENLFHGESSGVDIAVALSGTGLRFVRDGAKDIFENKWEPRWYISYSGKRGVTIDAVNKVKALLAVNPEKGQSIDQRMQEAVCEAEQALQQNSVEGFDLLKKAINKAASCFEEWELNDGMPTVHMNLLRDKGAVAVKPTGSGGGGYVLSLWEKNPPDELKDILISC